MKLSQNERILNHLKQGKKLNPLQALKKFGCFRLGARVYDLKKSGHNISCDYVASNGKHFAQYKLN